MTVKENVHCRISGLPQCPEVHRSTIPRLKDHGQFLCIQGTIIKTTQARILEYKREYKCNKCAHEFTVHADYDQYYAIEVPPQCPNPNSRCKSTAFQPVEKNVPLYRRDFQVDFVHIEVILLLCILSLNSQEIKLQEPMHQLAVGTVPSSMWITLEDDLVDTCKPGDDVMVWFVEKIITKLQVHLLCNNCLFHPSGLVKRRWRPLMRGQRSILEIVLKGNYLEVKNEVKAVNSTVNEELNEDVKRFWSKHANAPLVGRNIILSSFCPQVLY